MLGLKLRDEFVGNRSSGTIVDFSNRRGTGALDRPAQDFLAITYPSVDLLKTIEAVQPASTRPVVIIGSRGQGKSHLMAALAHMLKDAQAGTSWLAQWASSAHNSAIGDRRTARSRSPGLARSRSASASSASVPAVRSRSTWAGTGCRANLAKTGTTPGTA